VTVIADIERERLRRTLITEIRAAVNHLEMAKMASSRMSTFHPSATTAAMHGSILVQIRDLEMLYKKLTDPDWPMSEDDQKIRFVNKQ
jgi:small neutral amino acid transporter SnatA (MarC family)